MSTGEEERQYQQNFNPRVFLQQRFRTPGTHINRFRDMRLELIHQFFNSLSLDKSAHSLKVLDYGSGPVVAFVLSAAGMKSVSEIVLAEYTAKNREALNQWMEKLPLAFNWIPYIKYVVQHLEKKPEQEVHVREERLRSLIKVASCDIKAEQPIEEGFEGPYDVVLTSLAIESTCRNETEYMVSIQKLSKLVKSRGHLYMFSKLAQESQSMFYELGGEQFHYYAVTDLVLLKNLKNAGFRQIKCVRIPISEIISGLSQYDAAQLEIHASEEFYYMSVIAEKTE